MSDLQLNGLKSQEMASDFHLRVIRCIHKNATEVHSENNEKFKYCKECISGENKKYRKRKALLKEVQVLCPGKFKNSCERGSPCISLFKNTKNKLFFAF